MLLTLVGCAKITGPYYLNQKKYEEGITHLGKELKENPGDASSAYYIGRYYLALQKPRQAMPYLNRAVRLDPANADYLFWTGVGHWALQEFDQERAAYQKALAINPRHLSAHLYLGHGYMDEGRWNKALQHYDTVLTWDKYNPEALYNRAEALNRLGKTHEEIVAWKKFLTGYPDGSLAMHAAERLNARGDFTYRNFILGTRNVTLRTMSFTSGTNEPDAVSKESLQVIAAIMQDNRRLKVHIVACTRDAKAAAKERAKNIRDYILFWNPRLTPQRFSLTGFGTAERIKKGGTTFTLDTSVRFITVIP